MPTLCTLLRWSCCSFVSNFVYCLLPCWSMLGRYSLLMIWLRAISFALCSSSCSIFVLTNLRHDQLAATGLFCPLEYCTEDTLHVWSELLVVGSKYFNNGLPRLVNVESYLHVWSLPDGLVDNILAGAFWCELDVAQEIAFYVVEFFWWSCISHLFKTLMPHVHQETAVCPLFLLMDWAQ